VFSGKSDPYCKVYIDNETTDALRTKMVKASLVPSWNQTLQVAIPADGCKLRMEVLDEDTTSDDFLGECLLDIGRGISAFPKQAMPLVGKDGARAG
jgi:Ca2+-dependent lipid-binding protein